MTHRRIPATLAAALIALSAFLVLGVAPVQPEWQATDGGKYLLFPSRAANTGAKPLVVVLHGYGGDARSMGMLWSLQPGLAGATVVAPQAPEKKRGGRAVSTWDRVDENYVLAVIDEVVSRHAIDASRIAVVGYSAGASMAIRLGLAHGDRFAAVVSIGGGLSMAAQGAGQGTRFLFVTGQRDERFSQDKFKHLFARLEKSGVKIERQVVPGADHAALYNRIDDAGAWLSGALGLTPPAGTP
ncbi:alpha/beta fold hydrolase [bacterium]|nr:alpha/beta fold hydrolase [bacterium]